MRTISPNRNYCSSQNLSTFDSNLDHLLEDLQNSISRPDINRSVTHYKGSYDSLNRIREADTAGEYSKDESFNNYSTDGGKVISSYKTETFVKKTPLHEGSSHRNISHLDNLLDDLKQVKKSSSTYESALDSEMQENRTSVSKKISHFESGDKSLLQQYTNEGSYGDIKSLRPVSPSSRTSTLSKQTKVTNIHSYPMETYETTTTPEINPEILAHLDPVLHPPSNTKVTTTIKTYTYEIPANYTSNLDCSSTEYLNQTMTTPSKSFIYNKNDNKSQTSLNYNQNSNWKLSEREVSTTDRKVYPQQRPSTPSAYTETITTRNYQPGYVPHPDTMHNETYVYNETVTTRDVGDESSERIIKDDKIITKTNRNQMRQVPTIEQTPPNNYLSNESYTYKYEQSKKEPVDIRYNYKSQNTTTSTYKGSYPPKDNSRQPLLPKPFPTENQPDGPPKRLDDLMASIGQEPPNSPYNAGFNAHEKEMEHKRKIESLKQQHTEIDDMQQKKEPIQRSKNVSGPPVYYPPGHEMFAKKEERGGWRAEGAYGRESGKYQYEAENKSKSKSSSGKAIVPICLPLCCGLPCTIL